MRTKAYVLAALLCSCVAPVSGMSPQLPAPPGLPAPPSPRGSISRLRLCRGSERRLGSGPGPRIGATAIMSGTGTTIAFTITTGRKAR